MLKSHSNFFKSPQSHKLFHYSAEDTRFNSATLNSLRSGTFTLFPSISNIAGGWSKTCLPEEEISYTEIC